jgi:hypothetical protein
VSSLSVFKVFCVEGKIFKSIAWIFGQSHKSLSFAVVLNYMGLNIELKPLAEVGTPSVIKK